MKDEKRKALGRGLESLLPSRPAVKAAAAGVAVATAAVVAQAAAPAPVAPGAEGVRDIAVDQIDPSPFQTRRTVAPEALDELAESIKRTGVLQPIVVRYISENARYQLIAGERRWRASQKAGKTTIPAVVKQCSNELALVMTIVENLQREDLNPMEQARGFERLAREFGLTQEQIAESTGKPRPTITNYLRLLKLPAPAQDAVETGQISFGHAKAMMGLDTPEEILNALKHVITGKLSVRATEDLVNRMLLPKPVQEPAPPKLADPNVAAAARQLQEALGMRVQIKDRKGKGKIVIEYRSLEDFDRILEALS
jgi:ParB family transcriptional regulator, chromosome partitioning protein